MGSERTLQMIGEYAVVTNVDVVALSFGGHPLLATDLVTRDLETWQYVCGEGPSIEAYAHNAPIGTSDVTMWKQRWMWLADALNAWPYRAAFAFPVTIGPVALGALAFYRHAPGPMTSSDRAAALICADHAAHWLADTLLDGRAAHMRDFDRLHRAAGVVMAQTGADARDAIAMIRAHTFGTERRLVDVVSDILEMKVVLAGPLENDGPHEITGPQEKA